MSICRPEVQEKVPEVKYNCPQEIQYSPTWSKCIGHLGVVSTAIPMTHFAEFPCAPCRGPQDLARGHHVDRPPSPDVCDYVTSAAFSFSVLSWATESDLGRASGALGSSVSSANYCQPSLCLSLLGCKMGPRTIRVK